MSDEKRRDIYELDVGEQGGKDFNHQPSPLRNVANPSSTSASPSSSSSSSSSSPMANNAALPVLSYCASSILMTVTNKYVLSNDGYNLNSFLLAVQAVVCIIAIETCKRLGLITYRDFNKDEARKWFPISLLLIGMIYTGSKAIAFLSIPVYTIFKNLTIILIAYGEVLWFGGSVTPMALFSFGLMVISSIIAAWADIKHVLEAHGASSAKATEAISTLNAGYLWMLINCLCSASYILGMRKRIKLTNFKDFDTTFYNNLLTIPTLLIMSLLIEDWSSANIAKNFPADTRNIIIFTMIVSGISAVFISYTSAWCVRVTSSTTYSMVGALNKLPIAVSGLIFFNEPVTFPKVCAIVVGFISGLIYTHAKMRQNSKPKVGGQSAVPLLPTTERGTMSASSQSMRDSLKS